jgi:DNA-binding GntR family transcriptional regulator
MTDDIAREAAFARAYRMTREAIERTAGTGRRFLVGELTRATGLSPTPVREALSRLVGEGLVDEHRGGGYFSARLDARDIVESYTLARILALAAIAERTLGASVQRTRRLAAALGSLPEPPDARITHLFERLAIDSGNRLLAVEMRRLNGRMAGLRRAEVAILVGLEEWAKEIPALMASADGERQIRWVECYCLAGQENADALADWLSA